MDMRDNPWAERFTPLLDDEEIFRRARVVVPPLKDLCSLPDEAAYQVLEASLKRVYYPTSQCVALLREWAGLAHAYCCVQYPSRRVFLTRVYDKSPPLQYAVQLVCFTGMAGLGKTQLIQAFERIQIANAFVTADEHHDPFPMRSTWSTKVEGRNSSRQVLLRLSGIPDAGEDIIHRARKRAYRDGVAFVGIDEFQFVTQSSKANSLVTQILLSISYLGLPTVYVANYSLVHKLMRRPQEDRQRLLAKPLVLLPDPPESEDWIQTLAALKAVAPDVLVFDPTKDARDIYLFSAGIKRLVVQLLVQAYRISRQLRGPTATVDIKDIEAAYRSPMFTSDRIDVEIIARQEIEGRMIREDLWSPFGKPQRHTAREGVSGNDRANVFAEAREERVAEEALKSSLTKSEREVWESLTKGDRTKAGRATSLSRKAPTSAEDLKKNAERLRKQFT